MFSNQLNRQIPITSKGDVWIVSVVDILRFNLKAYLIYPVISLKVEKCCKIRGLLSPELQKCHTIRGLLSLQLQKGRKPRGLLSLE